MPIYEYKIKEGLKGCGHCKDGFEILQKLSDEQIAVCPECGKDVTKQISAPSIGGSESSFDERAKTAGFSKLKKLGKGEYEKQY